MTRTAWLLLALLVASNLAWFALSPGARESGGEAASYEETIADLQDEVARLHASAAPTDAEPSLHVGGSSDLGPDAAREEAAATPPSEVEGDPPTEAERADARARAEALRAHQAESLERVKAMLRKVMQVRDPALRREGLDELAAALRSTDATLVEYSLSALHSMRVEGVDRSVFREQVLDLLTSENGGIRRAALYALHATGPREGDARHALAGVTDEDPVVRQHVARVLKLYGGGAFEGAAGDALVALLRDENRNVRRGTLRALDGARIDDDAAKALVALARVPEDRYEVVQHGLSGLAQKSRPVIDALFDHLGDENVQVRARAHWGLQRGIPEAQRPYVARRYAEHLDTFVNPKSHQEALKLIARFGDASLAPQVERFAGNELVDARVREMAAKVAEHLRSK